MPPRYAYWTIIVDNQPTAFRAGAKEDLLPTFNRLKAKNDTAVMMWFQNGKLWPSRLDAQEAMLARGEMGRRGDSRQAGFRDRDRKPTRDRVARSAWSPRGEPSTPAPARNADDKLDWKPKGEFTPAPKRSEKPDWKPKGSFDRERKPDWKPKGFAAEGGKPGWKPKGSFDRDRKPKSFARPEWKPSGDDTRSAKPEWKPKGSFTRESKPDWKSKTQDARPRTARSEKPDWKPKGSFDRERKTDWKPRGKAVGANFSSPGSERKKPGEKLEWKPKGETSEAEGRGPRRSPEGEGGPPKRKWVPKAEYKKSLGIEAKRDDKWRPGGEHRDPKQKYKDAKKAKWSKFKTNIRQKWEKKAGKKSDK
jgi:hypothetical protein